jgi:hypothetical protein
MAQKEVILTHIYAHAKASYAKEFPRDEFSDPYLGLI